jgi:hypothetical protein
MDLGTLEDASVDYPDFPDRVGKALGSEQAECGVLSYGIGLGITPAECRSLVEDPRPQPSFRAFVNCHPAVHLVLDHALPLLRV